MLTAESNTTSYPSKCNASSGCRITLSRMVGAPPNLGTELKKSGFNLWAEQEARAPASAENPHAAQVICGLTWSPLTAAAPSVCSRWRMCVPDMEQDMGPDTEGLDVWSRFKKRRDCHLVSQWWNVQSCSLRAGEFPAKRGVRRRQVKLQGFTLRPCLNACRSIFTVTTC